LVYSGITRRGTSLLYRLKGILLIPTRFRQGHSNRLVFGVFLLALGRWAFSRFHLST
jgi:hypothetical protein